jgi:uncharacterized protein
MSPEERQLLNGLFDRTRNVASTPRDPEAEALITDQVKAQPYASYLLAQAVIVQEQALKAANEKLQALEAQIAEMERQQPGRAPAPAGSGFLSGLSSLFGAGNPQSAPPPQPRGPDQSPWQQPPQGFGQQNYGQPPSQSPPWGAGAPQAGGFLKGALGAAAGVAGGVLLANSIRGLFGQHNNPFGISSGLGNLGQNPGGETVVNNYYENSDPDLRSNANFADSDHAGPDDASYDSGSDDYDV